MDAVYCRRAGSADLRALRRDTSLSPAFVTASARKPRLVVDYYKVNECLDDLSFRMDRLGDLAQLLRPVYRLTNADIEDTYYHLRPRAADQLYLAFLVIGVIYVPQCLNCGLSVPPWFFTRAMRPVVAHLCLRGHRVYS
jgi:hypothetical protein